MISSSWLSMSTFPSNYSINREIAMKIIGKYIIATIVLILSKIDNYIDREIIL